MRVALLSLMEAVASEPHGLRGYLPIGGRSVVRHQLGLALALGCTRIVVLAEALTGELVALQHTAESAGARFHVIAAQKSLAALVSPEDDLFVLCDGLLAMPADALKLLNDGPAILVLPVEVGLGAGFERIDINNAHAGAMRLPGRLVSGLGDLPSEWNPVSALLRIAVQGSVPLKPVPTALLEEGRWRLLRDEGEAQRTEPVWLRLHTATDHPRTLGQWLAALAVQRLGPALLHAGTRPWLIGIAAFIAALLGLGAAWFGWSSAGFMLLGMAALLLMGASLLTRIERDSLLANAGKGLAGDSAMLLLDAGFITLCAWRSEIPVVIGVPGGIRWFAPLVLILLLRLLPQVLPPRIWTWWMMDRFVAAMGLALVSAALPFDFTLRAVVAILLGAALFVVRRQSGVLTPH